MNIFSQHFKISSFDLNPQGQARLTTMANFFQEIAYHHANELGLGYEAMKRMNHIWALSRMRIRMHRYPVWNENIRIETWPSGAEKLFALRDFRVLDAEGREIGMASTAWLILDLETHRLIRPKELMEQFKMIIHDLQMFGSPLDKITYPGETSVLNQHKVLFSDLDIVGHVNNVKYMEWCIDAHTTEENAGRNIQEFEINFNHEALLGDSITIEGVESGPGEIYFRGRREVDGREIISARMKQE